MYPRDIILRLCETYDKDDISVLADWCETVSADRWMSYLRGKFLAYQAHAVAEMAFAFMPKEGEERIDGFNLSERWVSQLIAEGKMSRYE